MPRIAISANNPLTRLEESTAIIGITSLMQSILRDLHLRRMQSQENQQRKILRLLLPQTASQEARTRAKGKLQAERAEYRANEQVDKRF